MHFVATVRDASLRPPRPPPYSLLHTRVRALTEHMDEEKLGDVPIPELDVLLFEGGADARTFLSYHPSLLCGGLARTHRPDELPQLDRHGSTLPLLDPRGQAQAFRGYARSRSSGSRLLRLLRFLIPVLRFL